MVWQLLNILKDKWIFLLNMSANKFQSSISCLLHDTISSVENLSHQVINIASEKSIPILNEMLQTNLDTNLYSYPTYHSQKIDDRILVYIEIPGVKKENCQLIYKRGSIEFRGETSYREDYNFLKSKKYLREIKIPIGIERDNVTAIYENGVIYLNIQIPNISQSNIPVSEET